MPAIFEHLIDSCFQENADIPSSRHDLPIAAAPAGAKSGSTGTGEVDGCGGNVGLISFSTGELGGLVAAGASGILVGFLSKFAEERMYEVISLSKVGHFLP